MPTSKTRRRRVKIGISSALLLATLILIGTLNNTTGPAKPLGFLAIASILALGALMPVAYFSLAPRVGIPSQFLQILAWGSIFGGAYVIGVVQDGFSSRAVSNMLQVWLIMSFFFATALVSWKERALQILGWTGSVFIVSLACWWLGTGAPMGFSGYLANPNTLGPIVFVFLFFVVYRRGVTVKSKWYSFVVILGVLVIFATAARSVWLSAIVTGLVYAGWGGMIHGRLRFQMTLLICFVGIFAATYIYAIVSQMHFSMVLNQVVYEYTGKNLLSGRDALWVHLISIAKEKWLIGYGSATLPSEFLDTGFSSHNLYLQTVLQVGVVGVVAFLGIIWSVWRVFWEGRDLFVVRISGSFLMGFLVHQIFEVSMTQTNVAIGLTQWLVIGVGASKAIEHYRRKVSRT